MTYKYHKHEEVPIMLRNYIMTVSQADFFEELDLTNINVFLNELEEFYNRPIDSTVIYQELAMPLRQM
jgi:hypothetical protein